MNETVHDIAVCAHCGAKNRLKEPPAGQVPACGRCGEDLPWLIQASDGTFDREIRAGVPVLVDFWAPWCGPCRMVAPVLDDLSRELAGKLKVVKLNVDENPITSSRFQVRSIPMLGVFRGGILVDQVMGAVPKGALMQRLADHLPS